MARFGRLEKAALDVLKLEPGPFVWEPTESYRVKNLGWLRKHAEEITGFTWIFVGPLPWSSGFLLVHLTDDRVFATRYADFRVFWQFVNRPIFAGHLVLIYDATGKYVGEFRTQRRPRDASMYLLPDELARSFMAG